VYDLYLLPSLLRPPNKISIISLSWSILVPIFSLKQFTDERLSSVCCCRRSRPDVVCRQDDAVDSRLTSDNSTLHRRPVPWTGSPADRGTLYHVRRPDQQFQTLTSTLPHSNYCAADSEADFLPPGDGQRYGWGGCQRPPPGADHRVQEWTERNTAVYRGPTSDYYTLGARKQQRQLYNGAVGSGSIADNTITAANVNRFVHRLFSYLMLRLHYASVPSRDWLA